MALSARAWTLPDEILARCIHSGINELDELARIARMPMPGMSIPTTTQTFNKLQMQLVIPELRTLAEVAPGNVAAAAVDLLSLAELVGAKAHRYLVFIGD